MGGFKGSLLFVGLKGCFKETTFSLRIFAGAISSGLLRVVFLRSTFFWVLGFRFTTSILNFSGGFGGSDLSGISISP
jgi:hypothetical protein